MTPPTIAPMGLDLVADVEGPPTSAYPLLLILCAVAALNDPSAQVVGFVVAQYGIRVPSSVRLAGKYVSESSFPAQLKEYVNQLVVSFE
jgi:hypothetical protein